MSFADREMSISVNFKERYALRDKKLVTEAQAGSSAAFAELQSIYWRQLYSTVIAITRNREDAEDALQDTFLRAYIALRDFEGRSSVYSWLTRIAINSALMILRKRRTRAEVFSESPFDEVEGHFPEVRDRAPNPEQICDLHQRSTHLQRAIQKLEPKLRAPIQILLMHECSMKEIAQALDLTVAAVKTRLHRARGRLTTARVARHAGAGAHLQSGSKRKDVLCNLESESCHA